MKKLCYILFCGLLAVLTACEKDTMADSFAPEVTTGAASGIYRKGATLSGSIRFSEGMGAESYGIRFSAYRSMAEYEELAITDGSTEFSVLIKDLEPGKTYYFCSYAYGGFNTVCGEVRSFTTSESNAPVFSVPIVSGPTEKSFIVTSELLDDGGSDVMLSGFCYDEADDKAPNFMDRVSNVTLSGNTITATIRGVAPLRTYQIRAYGASVKGLAYSEMATVTTEKAIVPFLSPVTLKDSTLYSMTAVAKVLEQGSAEVTAKGFCWSIDNPEPTIDNNNIPCKPEEDEFSIHLKDLTLETTYYICAYAVNEYGIGYSEVFAYSTAEKKLPELSTITQAASTDLSVSVRAKVIDGGIPAFTESGFCWSATTQEPTISDSTMKSDGKELDMTLNSLKPATTYYIRAYATNEVGTAYGEVFAFTTADAKAPTVSAVTQTASSNFSVSFKADITDTGTADVSESGFCWSTANQLPTTADNKNKLNGPTLGMTLSDLDPATTYYIRAYATNEVGTTYSEVFTFTTAEAKTPVLSAITQTASTYFSVSVKADITDVGTADLTESGFCWSATNQVPTTTDSRKELDGPSLTMNLENLEPGITYYIRAYATNRFGTTYSEVFTFTAAEAKAPTLSAITQTATADFSVSVKAEITDAGTADVIQSGFCWSITNQTPTTADSKKELTGMTLEATLSDLAPGTTYYIRAFATNKFGTSYSTVSVFKTAYKDVGNGNTNIDDLPTNNW